MCRKKQVNPTCRASPPTWKTAGFKPLETIPSVLPWLAVLNKKGRGGTATGWKRGGYYCVYCLFHRT
jgi:hypothetical protein